MMIRKYLPVIILLLGQTSPASAKEGFLTSRCNNTYPEAMSFVQEQLVKRGYTVSRVQHVDKGLKARGYESLRYRVVFFGKSDEISMIKSQYPALIPFFPLNITVYEEKDHVGISVMDPMTIQQLYTEDMLKNKFSQWSQDVRAIVKSFEHCES